MRRPSLIEPRDIMLLRLKWQISAARLARLLSVSERTIYLWEKGHTAPSLIYVVILEQLNTKKHDDETMENLAIYAATGNIAAFLSWLYAEPTTKKETT